MKKKEKLDLLKEELSALSDLRDTRKILVYGEIKEEMAREIVKDILILTEQLARKKKASNREITILISSEGGDVAFGREIMAAIQEAQKRGIRCMGVVNSHAESMGFFILQACDYRVMGRGAFLMVHGPTYVFHGDSKALEAERKLGSHIQDSLVDLMVRKNTQMTKEWWKQVLGDNRNLYFTSEEALERQFVDMVTDE